jgi:hypothetical protein
MKISLTLLYLFLIEVKQAKEIVHLLYATKKLASKDLKQAKNIIKKKLRGFGPLTNYADRATAASWRSSTNFCG